jgi:hypothetical protein
VKQRKRKALVQRGRMVVGISMSGVGTFVTNDNDNPELKSAVDAGSQLSSGNAEVALQPAPKPTQ